MDQISFACQLLEEGKLVGLPTETVYGLGALASDALAVAAIFERKGRPHFNPLIAHVWDLEAALDLIEVPEIYTSFLEKYWPGPLTVVGVMKQGASVCDLARAGLETLAVRIPNHEVTLDLLRRLDRPVVAPSANLSGSISPTTRQHVLQDFPDLFVLEGGACGVGVESTILDLSGDFPVLLRPGAITLEMMERLGPVKIREEDGPVTAPGQLKRHYAPKSPLRLNVVAPRPDETYIAFGPGSLSLSEAGDLLEAAARLFMCLREADARGRPIAVAPIPDVGIGRAINDRLRRAAHSEDSHG